MAEEPAARARGEGLRGPWLLVLAMGLGVFVGGFDQTFVVPVLGEILDDFDVPLDRFGHSAWVLNGYLLGYTVALPLMGRIADVYGHVRVFVLALLVFMGGSVLVALAPTLATMALARAVTAIGGGALVPVALALAADTLPRAQRPLGLSAVSVLDDTSSLLGPLWGTLIGVWLGWRGLFWINLLLAAPVLIAVVVVARRSQAAYSRGQSRLSGTVDWFGGVLLAGALLAGAWALTGTGSGPLPVTQFVPLLALAGLLSAAFVVRERQVAVPLVRFGTFRSRPLLLALVLFFIEGAALIVALVDLPLMADILWDKGGAGPGLILMRMVLFMLLGGVVGGFTAALLGVRTSVATGFALAAAGLAGMALWPEQPGPGVMWLALAVAGFGFTLSDASLYLVVVEGVEASRRASAAAILQVAQTTGMIVGLALLASQGLGRFDHRAEEIFAEQSVEADASAYRAAVHQTFDETLAAAATVMGVGVLAAVGLRHPRPRPVALRGWRAAFAWRSTGDR